ncbi:hypothetical protein GCM10029992_01550 [Glycomyces albus]
MTLSWRRGLTVFSAIAAVIAGLALAGDPRKRPRTGRVQVTGDRVRTLRGPGRRSARPHRRGPHRTPRGTQVSATEIEYDGLDVTVDPLYSESDFGTTAISCDHGWFCIDVRGTRFEFYTCKTWSLSDWWGNSPFNNNQTSGTLAQAWDNNGNRVFAHIAKGSGTENVFDWWWFRPC